MNPEDVRSFLQATQQLRIRWSASIAQWDAISLTGEFAIWALFLKSYFESGGGTPGDSTLLLLPAILSAFWLRLWRWNVREIDRQIMELYPDFIYCERVMQIPLEHGTTGYLLRNGPQALRAQIERVQQGAEANAEGVRDCIRRVGAGARGHIPQEILAGLGGIAPLPLVVFVSYGKWTDFVGWYILALVALLFVLWPWLGLARYADKGFAVAVERFSRRTNAAAQ